MPHDPVSQIALTLPTVLLYELFFAVKLTEKQRAAVTGATTAVKPGLASGPHDSKRVAKVDWASLPDKSII